jgi:arylsulfatase A-like enzyme
MMTGKRILTMLGALLASAALSATAPAAEKPHNVVLFVADGLRGAVVNDQTAPTMAALLRRGVWLRNGHALFPTFTTANASGLATGHQLGDTGDFSNTIYAGFPVAAAAGSVTPFIENDKVLGELDAHFGGDYLDAETILKLARDQGFGTAAIGKLGPTLIFDHTERSGQKTLIVDDATGTANGIPLNQEVADRLAKLGLPAVAPPRGENAPAGNATTPGTHTPNGVQQEYFAAVATRVALPLLAARGQPFVLVFWSRDPDGTQHNQGDSLLKLSPGINGPTSMAAIRNADDDLARIEAALAELGLTDSTDLIVTADHGFSTISKQSATSDDARQHFADVPEGLLSVGFLAHDLAKAFGLPLLDPDNGYAAVGDGAHSKFGNGLIGADKDHPRLVVAANGGSDLIYIPDGDKETARRAVEALLAEDYVSGIFVDSRLGRFPGALSLADIGLEGKAVTPVPAIAVSFRSFCTICGEPLRCSVEIADTGLQQGQGMHGSFSRADTWNFMAAVGPSFRSGFIDLAPTSNADVGQTIAHLMGLKLPAAGTLTGRVIEEALVGGTMPEVHSDAVLSDPAPNGLRTVLDRERVGGTIYYDVAGFPGRTLGLLAEPQQN